MTITSTTCSACTACTCLPSTTAGARISAAALVMSTVVLTVSLISFVSIAPAPFHSETATNMNNHHRICEWLKPRFRIVALGLQFESFCFRVCCSFDLRPRSKLKPLQALSCFGFLVTIFCLFLTLLKNPLSPASRRLVYLRFRPEHCLLLPVFSAFTVFTQISITSMAAKASPHQSDV